MTRSSSEHGLENGSHHVTRTTACVIGGMTAAFLCTKAASWGMAAAGMLLTTSIVTAMARTPPSGGVADQPDVNAEVIRATDAYRTAVLAGDARSVAALYRDDAIELPPCRTPVKGRAAIEQRYRDLFDGRAPVTAFTFSHIASAIDGDLAYDVGTYRQRLSLPSGEAIGAEGKYLVLLRRTEGAWKAAFAIYSSDAGSMTTNAGPSGCPVRPHS
jgi:uncharacterized protein (TIGR02246 family)